MGLIELQSVNATRVNPSWDRPVFLKGHCKDIPAIKKCKDKSYLRNKFNNAIIDVEVYKNKKDYQKSLSEKEQWKFNEYLNELNSDKQLYLSDCSLNTL